MGPVESVFITIFIIFGVVGIVRGQARELGVTTMLLLALLVLELVGDKGQAYLNLFVEKLTVSATAATMLKTLLFCGFLILVAYISYEGETLTFPGKGRNTLFSLGAGLLNGYLFAGSLWYYLDAAGWLGLGLIQKAEFTGFYKLMVNYLPPKVFTWQYLIGLAVFMLIMRVWK